MTHEEHWDRFIEYLNKVQPLNPKRKDGEPPSKHVNFLGSIAAYKKIFMAANTPKVENEARA